MSAQKSVKFDGFKVTFGPIWEGLSTKRLIRNNDEWHRFKVFILSRCAFQIVSLPTCLSPQPHLQGSCYRTTTCIRDTFEKYQGEQTSNYER